MQIRCTPSGVWRVAIFTAAGLAYAATLSNADKQFLAMAAKTDMIEAHEGQMAQMQATKPQVKDFGKTLVQDHTESYEHLTELAARTGASIPKGIDAGKDRSIVQLLHLKGDRFDRQFAADEIAAHRRAIAEFKTEAAHGKDADVKAYASKMIPVLEKDLHLAEQDAKAAPLRKTAALR